MRSLLSLRQNLQAFEIAKVTHSSVQGCSQIRARVLDRKLPTPLSF